MNFYQNKKVLITGNTGFKGTWLTRILLLNGANVCGYSLNAPSNPNMFELLGINSNIQNIKGDILDFDKLKNTINKFKPDVIFHLAAQPIVRKSYEDPITTYKTNVLGTLNLLEAIRGINHAVSVVNVTTDKVYLNKEWEWGYREDEALDGFDPYSNSKSCSELITHCYINSFFKKNKIPVSTARAGNVIGGGDFAADRIIPDCVRAQINSIEIKVRNPNSTRPYQHVLEPLFAYLMIAAAQAEDYTKAGFYNVGPDDIDCRTTGEIVDLFCKYWGNNTKWTNINEENAPHEANFLKLDSSRIKRLIGWKPNWHVDEAIKKSCEWYKAFLNKENLTNITDKQIISYQEN